MGYIHTGTTRKRKQLVLCTICFSAWKLDSNALMDGPDGSENLKSSSFSSSSSCHCLPLSLAPDATQPLLPPSSIPIVCNGYTLRTLIIRSEEHTSELQS